MKALIDKIKNKKINIAVIGLGYVGLPLAVEFCKSGFKVVGIDIDQQKIATVAKGKSYIRDAPEETISNLVKNGLFTASSSFSPLEKTDATFICVPTPLNKTKDPDISYILDAANQIKKCLHKEQLVVLESTTYPGTTRELILPILEETGLKLGVDFYLAFSPERIDPGNSQYTLKNTPKLVGGITKNCTHLAKLLYRQIIDTVVSVSSPEVAEMAKLLENTFRSVNIALVNEMALMCDKLKIDVWEVIDAAATKSFGFIPFYPGPGLGGNCLPVDPNYLSWKMRTLNYQVRFVDLATQINTQMPYYVVHKLLDVVNIHLRKSISRAKILILGVTYKRDVDDVRESPAIDIIKLLLEKKADVAYHDPYIPQLSIDGKIRKSVPLTSKLLQKMDCTAIITDHTCYDYDWIVQSSKLILDNRNATKNVKKGKEKILKL
ncbi:MAG: nucleotide sugar dehydrogenase [bacterium]